MLSDVEPSAPVSWRVVEAIAHFEGCDPTDLDPLFEVIDLDAVDAFDATANCNWTLEFTLDGTYVAIYDGRTIRIRSLNER